MSMATRSQMRRGARLVDPGLDSDGGVRAVSASSSIRSRGEASAGPDPLETFQDGASFSHGRGRNGLPGRERHDRDVPSANTRPVRGHPVHAFFQQDLARSDDLGRSRGPNQNEVERTRAGGVEFSTADDLLSARAQGGRGFEIPLPHMGRVHAPGASYASSSRTNMANSAPPRAQGRGGAGEISPGTAGGYGNLPRSFQARLAEDGLDEGLSPKLPARGIHGEKEEPDDLIRNSARGRAEILRSTGAFERLPPSALGASKFDDFQGKPSQNFFRGHMRASAMPGEVSKEQRHVDPWEYDMDVTEAMKVISNLKFEEETNKRQPRALHLIRQYIKHE